jgi:hypothetical protein
VSVPVHKDAGEQRHRHRKEDPMEHPDEKAPEGGDFARGEETLPHDPHKGSFAEGEETLPHDEHKGSFAEGEETEPHGEDAR